MAIITFYGVDDIDQQRFTELLGSTEHSYELRAEPLSLQNSNPSAQVISIFVNNPMTRELMDSMPNLKLIATRSTGFDHIDMAAAREKNIAVVNVPRYGEETVAEFAFALLLAISRKLIASRDAAYGDAAPESLQGFDLAGKTIGIIGTGRIGQHMARIAKGFGMKVIAYDLYPNENAAADLGFSYVSLEDLASTSDVISLHAPATPETHHLIDKTFLERVKSRCIVLNTARGELVDTAALVAALDMGKLGGAGLDVLEYEALLHDSSKSSGVPEVTAQAVANIAALKQMPNVILTPHNAFNTHEAVDRIRQTTVQNINDFYKGEMPNEIRN